MRTAVLLVTFAFVAASGTAAPGGPPPPPCAACLAPVIDPADADALARLDVRLDGVDLVVDSAMPGPQARAALAAAGARLWVRVQAPAEEIDLAGVTGAWIAAPARGMPDELVFAIRRTATSLRAKAPGLVVGLVLDDRIAAEDPARALAPYIDALRVPVQVRLTEVDLVGRFPGTEVWNDADRVDALGAVEARAHLIVRAVDAVLLARQIAALREVLVPGLTPLADLRVSCDGCRVSTFLHPDTLHAIAVVESALEVPVVRVDPAAAGAAVVDVDAPAAPAAASVERGEVRLPPGLRRFVLDLAGWRGPDEAPFRDVVTVTASRRLTVEEILARHQAWQARQAALVRTAIATGTTVVTFEVPGFAGPATVTANTRTFTRGALVEMEQRDIRMNGVDLAVDGRAPRLPIIEPERVMTPPLVIALGTAYDYRLDGREPAAGRECYVVAFSPRAGDRPSFTGRAWIDAATFALVRMEAVQTGLGGAIVSARQRDEFGPVRVADREAWLPVRSTSDQIYQAAGFRTPIHREVVTSSHEVNPGDFEARREAALRSRAVILRDTPAGYEYLVPAPQGSEGTAVRVPAPRAGRRVVTLAFGLIDDPNITVPLPYAGLSYLDFDLLGRGIQVSGFFGGTYGQAAWTVPGVLRRGWQLTGRAFGIAARYNDRSFRRGVERYDENILQRPAHLDAALVVPLTPRVQLRAGYELDYVAYRANDDTSRDFIVPVDAVVHGARVGLDVQTGSWSALAWWNPARRQGWRPWGAAATTEYRPGTKDFARYGVTLARAWVLSPGSVARVEASWVDGHDLDRFSRYTVDGFDNRLRGYPSASLRYDHGAIVRSVATWTPVGRVRLDGFADLAVVRDPGFGPDLRGYPGVGLTAEVPLPARLLLAVEWGYGFNARNTDGTRGTQVIRVAGVKVF